MLGRRSYLTAGVAGRITSVIVLVSDRRDLDLRRKDLAAYRAFGTVCQSRFGAGCRPTRHSPLDMSECIDILGIGMRAVVGTSKCLMTDCRASGCERDNTRIPGVSVLVDFYIFGVGIVPAASKVPVDWITKRNQEPYKTPGTEGHGVPVTSFISGLIGGLLGGFGGGLVYYGINTAVNESTFVTDPAISIGLAAILGVGVFFINSVIASYNIGGTIEGMHDPKFKRIGTGALACAIASIVVGIFCIILTGGI